MKKLLISSIAVAAVAIMSAVSAPAYADVAKGEKIFKINCDNFDWEVRKFSLNEIIEMYEKLRHQIDNEGYANISTRQLEMHSKLYAEIGERVKK